MNRKSIRFRLTVWYTLALTAGLLVFAIAIWVSMWRTLFLDTDRMLNERMRSTQHFLEEELKEPNVKLGEELSEYALALPDGTFLQVRNGPGPALYASPKSFPWSLVPDTHRLPARIAWNGHQYRTLSGDMTLNHVLWHISFAISLDSVLESLAKLRWLLITLIPAVVCAASLGGFWLSRRALRPVDEITMAAQEIGIQNLSRRLIVPQTGDELQRLSETWNAMLSRLEDAVSRLSRFTADASHELRTPLAIIRSTAEIASRRQRPAETYREALEQIALESERMTALIEDLLFLARCDAENLELPMERLLLDTLIEDVFSVMKPVADLKGVSLIRDAMPANIPIAGNRSAIRRLLLVLVDNAIKYSGAGEIVRISLEVMEDKAKIRVSDNGPGIPEVDLPFLFQRFYRGFNGRQNGNTGVGLGLALASGIAQYHRSEIKVQSVLGEGSQFDVSFPLEGS